MPSTISGELGERELPISDCCYELRKNLLRRIELITHWRIILLTGSYILTIFSKYMFDLVPAQVKPLLQAALEEKKINDFSLRFSNY